MSAPIHRINPTLRLIKCTSFDSIIDVRSPSEFREDHMPNAINLPVLDDIQRESIGTIYKQSNPFEAKRAGAALVAQNISVYLQTELAEKTVIGGLSFTAGGVVIVVVRWPRFLVILAGIPMWSKEAIKPIARQY